MMFGGCPIPKQFNMALYASMFNLVICYISAYVYWDKPSIYNLGLAIVSLAVGGGIYYWTRKQIHAQIWNSLKQGR